MNAGDIVQDASRPGLDEASGFGADAGQGDGSQGRSPAQKPLQDIQDLIDKLAAVTQQLRRPRSSVAGPSKLDSQPAEQAHGVGGGQRRGPQQRERPDVAGHVGLALQVDAA